MEPKTVTELTEEDLKVKGQPWTMAASVKELEITSDKELALRKLVAATRTIPLPYFS